jgi:hypothetical protein
MEQHPHHPPDDEPYEPDQHPSDEVPIDGTPLEKVSAYLRIAFAQADTRGEAITREDAQDVATLLAQLLPPNSEMHRFAESGDAHPALIHEECQTLKGRKWQTRDIDTWLQRLEHHLASRTDLGRQTAPVSAEAIPPDNPQIEQGLREHGDAFRAYLRLPDIDHRRDDLLETFHEVYVGRYASTDALLGDLTEVRDWANALNDFARQQGIDGLVFLDRSKVERLARLTWDIIEIGGKFYVFTK